MKKAFCVAILATGLFSCTEKWEYKTVSVKGSEQGTLGKFESNKFDVSDTALNLFGRDGWELVGVYEKTETVHPNFGNDEYVSGIQPNVRTAEIDFVFKRKK
jgi:hypothetical protein